MKKLFCTLVSLLLVAATLSPIVAMAAVEEDVPEWQDVTLTDEEFEAILANGNSYETNTNARASDLIASYGIGISNDGTTLYIAGETVGTTEVVKAGFKEVVIQRRASSSSSWYDYITYEDLYWDQFAYNLAKSVTVPSGYQYRVTCVHYAKKNILSVQKLDNTSNTLTI